MSSLIVSIGSITVTDPSRRLITVSGSINVLLSPGRQVDNTNVTVTFGANGPQGSAHFTSSTDWSCTGSPASGLQPGSPLTVSVHATADLLQWSAADESFVNVGTVSGTASGTGQVPPAVPPTLTVNPVANPTVASQLPLPMTFTGSAVGISGPILVVQYAVEGWNGEFFSAVSTSGNYATWQVALPVPPGPHAIHFKALDRFLAGIDVTTAFTVLPQPPFTMPDGAKPTLSGAPSTSSITSWTRLEPQNNGADMGTSSSARVFDPLWMLTRQWQTGEFQGEDAGTPVQARLRATNAKLSRYRLGPTTSSSAQAAPYEPTLTPLEALVERRRMRAANSNEPRMLPFAVEAGLHFLRMLEGASLSTSYRGAFIAKLALQMPQNAGAAIDDVTTRYVQSMVGRAPDARLLADLLRTSGAAQLVLDTALNIAPADQPAVQQVATAWLSWYDTLYSEPSGASDDGWDPTRFEYAVSVGARLSATPQDEMIFSATEMDGSRLDWSAFDASQASLGTAADQKFTSLVETTVPAPVSFPGAPAARFWEMEDAKVAYGLVPVGPTDIAHLMMIEYASAYGNDWFLVPLTLPVGSVTRVDSLVVTDTFGVQNLLRPIGDPSLPAANFSLWQSTYAHPPAGSSTPYATNRFLLPPTLNGTLDGAPLEDVMLLRDEQANLAWAIERTIENGLEQPANRYQSADATQPDPALSASSQPADTPPRYLLSSSVPPNWIPLIPVRTPNPQLPKDATQALTRLRVGAVLQPDGSQIVHPAAGEILTSSAPLLLYDEEIPREGTRLTRQRHMTRWIDGSTWLWTSLRNQVGQGEGSSGLEFDQVLE